MEKKNADSKLDLISKLAQTLNKKEKTQEKFLQFLFDAYKFDETADKIIAEIKAA